MPQAFPRRKGLAAALLPAAGLLAAALSAAAPAGAAEEPVALPAPAADAAAEVVRGAYLVRAGGCVACHTDPKRKDLPLAGGRALDTPFGTFYTPNITPDPEYGIGAWSEADFLRALHEGRAPDGRPYYPAFPYTSYSGLSDRDARDIRAYLLTLPPVPRPDRAHDLAFPFGFRPLLALWRWLYFAPGRFQPASDRAPDWNRGAYLVRHLGHCGECHSPRNALGAVDPERALSGTLAGPDGKKVPNITPHEADGIGRWSALDVTYFLKTGFLPDGDFAGGAMTEVISESTAHLTDADRAAIAAYLLSLPPRAGP